MAGRKFQIGNVHREKGLFLSVYVDDIKLAGKTENIEPAWKILMEDVDLGEPTSFLDHENLGCTQRECQISQDFVANYRDMFESRISAGAKEKLPTHQRWQTNKRQHGELRTNRCPWFIDKLFKLSNTYISNISIEGSSGSYIAFRISKK